MLKIKLNDLIYGRLRTKIKKNTVIEHIINNFFVFFKNLTPFSAKKKKKVFLHDNTVCFHRLS